ncbi:MAG: hypothetical protein ACE5E6_09115, partial [Phycisphaerae bacterium]
PRRSRLPRGMRIGAGAVGLLAGAAVLVVARDDFRAARAAYDAGERLDAGDFESAIVLAERAVRQLNPQRALTSRARLGEAHTRIAGALQRRAAQRTARAQRSGANARQLLAGAAHDRALSHEHCRLASLALKELVARAPDFFNHGRLECAVNLIDAQNAVDSGASDKVDQFVSAAASAIEREILRQPFNTDVALQFAVVAPIDVDMEHAITILARPLRFSTIPKPYPDAAIHFLATPDAAARFDRVVMDMKHRLETLPIDQALSDMPWGPEWLRLAAVLRTRRGASDVAVGLLETAAAAYRKLTPRAPLGAAACMAELADATFILHPDAPDRAVDAATRALRYAPDSEPGRALIRAVRHRLVTFHLAAGDEDAARNLLRALGPAGTRITPSDAGARTVVHVPATGAATPPAGTIPAGMADAGVTNAPVADTTITDAVLSGAEPPDAAAPDAAVAVAAPRSASDADAAIDRQLGRLYTVLGHGVLRRYGGDILRTPPVSLPPAYARWIDRAVALAPDDFLARVLAADHAYRQDDRAEAMRQLREAVRIEPFDPVVALDLARVAGAAIAPHDLFDIIARPLRRHELDAAYVDFLSTLAAAPQFDAYYKPVLWAALDARPEQTDPTPGPTRPTPGPGHATPGETWYPEKLRIAATLEFLSGRYDHAETLLDRAVEHYTRRGAEADAIALAATCAALADTRFFHRPDQPHRAIEMARRVIALAPDTPDGRDLVRDVTQRMVWHYLADGNEAAAEQILRDTARDAAPDDAVRHELGRRYARMCYSLLQRRSGPVLPRPTAELPDAFEHWVMRAVELAPDDPLAHKLAADVAFSAEQYAATADHLRRALAAGITKDVVLDFLELARRLRPNTPPLDDLWNELNTTGSQPPENAPPPQPPPPRRP